MTKRVTLTKRAALEGRLQKLRKVRALLDPGKAANIVDRVGPDDASIEKVVTSLMSLMQAEDGIGQYHTAAKRLTAMLKKAFEEEAEAEESEPKDSAEAPKKSEPKEEPVAEEVEEEPAEESEESEAPAFPPKAPKAPEASAEAPAFPPKAPEASAEAPAEAPFPAAPAEAQGPDIQSMSDEQLLHEVQMLEQRLRQELAMQQSPEGMPPVAPHPAAPMPPQAQQMAPPPQEAPPMLSPENKLAILMHMPKAQRIAKAAKLRALANTLDEKPVSGDNEIENSESDGGLLDHYENQEAGSMKDASVKAFKKVLSKLIVAADETEEADAKDDEIEKEAVLKFALRHLLASIEDMQEEKSEDKEDEDKKEASLSPKRAILQARLASLRKQATVDGKSMSTPKEVPSSSGTTEDNLKGDAKIQYSTALADTSLDEIQERRQKIPADKQVAGNDEPNEIYQSNNPTENRYEPTSESDSSKGVNNKRVLKDEGVAVQKSEPSSPTEGMETGTAGTHQKTKDWEKAKSESDTTPSGDRLVGLASLDEIIKQRADRALKLAQKMAGGGLIKSQAQLHDQVVKLATMDDDTFEKIAEFITQTLAVASPTKKAEFNFEKKEDDKPKDEDGDSAEEKEESVHHEARRIRRASTNDEGDEVRDVQPMQRKSSTGIKTALLVGGEYASSNDLTAHGSSVIGNKLSKISWSDAVTKAREASDLDRFLGGSNPGLV